MAYEIRVVFQSLEAYQSAVDRLYSVFGAGLPATPSDVPPDELLDEPTEPSRETTIPLDRYLAEDPIVTGDAYSFTVEDRTR